MQQLATIDLRPRKPLDSVRSICGRCGGRTQSDVFIKDFPKSRLNTATRTHGGCRCEGERRNNDPRKKVNLLCRINGNEWAGVVVTDISQGGVGISTNRSNAFLSAGEEVSIAIQWDATKSFHFKAIVQSNKGNRTGLRFQDREHPDIQKQIKMFIAYVNYSNDEKIGMPN
jgi:hypothetical protein